MTRVAISKRIRFGIFKRDLFTCQYCGNSPPKVILELDHIFPVAKGGENDKDNLITACFDCNRGKGADLVEERDLPITEKHARVAEKEEQLKAYRRLLKRVRAREDADIDRINDVISTAYESSFSDSFRETIRTKFLPELEVDQLVGFMHMACGKGIEDPDSVVAYFCGICWRTIKGDTSRGRYR